VTKRKIKIDYRIGIHLFFIIFSLAFIIPFIYVLSISFSNDMDIKQYGYQFIPKTFDLGAYTYVFQNPEQLLSSYKITTFTSLVGTFCSVMIMALMAYPLSRSNFTYRKQVSFFVFFTMIFGGGLIPSYILITKYLRLGNTVWIYLFAGLANAWHIIIMRTFFQSLPSALVESAKMDGAGELKILFRIIMPLSKPVIATISLFILLQRWNDWATALVYINNKRLYTLQFLLQRILREAEFINTMMNEGMDNHLVGGMINIPTESIRFAMCVVAAGPMLIIFPFFQKYFVKGLTIGSVKG